MTKIVLLDGETTVTDITIKDFYLIAQIIQVTHLDLEVVPVTSSSYIMNCTVITQGTP